jgi:short-subunit dehydrogenase
LTLESDLLQYREALGKDDVNIKLLVNCAGFGKFDHDENIKLDTKLNMIDLNCKAIVSMCDFSLPYMHEDSAIINIASTAAFQPIPGINIYAATKSFVLSYSRALNQELKYRGIKVLAVCPFWTRTNFFDRAVVEGKKELVINYVAMYEAKDVVKRALNDLNRRYKDVSLYGFKNRGQVLLVKLLPHKIVMKVWMLQQKFDGTPNIRKDKSVN